MTRLTKADIRSLLEAGPAKSNVKVGQWTDLDASIRRAVSARAPGQPKPPAEKLKTVRTSVQGGREVVTHGEADVFDVASKLKGGVGYAENPSGKIVFKKQHSSVDPVPYYRQLRENCANWWCGTKTRTEELISPSNVDPTYARYAQIQKGFKTARTITASNLGMIEKGANTASKALPGKAKILAKGIAAGAKVQKTLIKPQNEDTMTGDIGSVAVPFVAPGESEDERNKKRKKRRKLATIMAVSTGSVQGIGN